MRWKQHVDGTMATVMSVVDLMGAAGPGVDQLLWEHGLRFLELSPGVPFLSLSNDRGPEAFTAGSLQREDAAGYGIIEGFYNPRDRRIVLRRPHRHAIFHEAAHALDHALDGYATNVLTGKYDRTRFDHRTGCWQMPMPREPISPYATTHPSERFAEAVAAYLDAEAGTFGRYGIGRLRSTDRMAAALVRRIFRELNGSAYELSVRPVG